MPTSLSIRPATPADIDRISDLEQTCFSSAWSRESIRYEICSNTLAYTLCAVGADDLVIGYLIGWKISPEFHLGNLAVHPVYRSKGIAQALCTHLLSHLKTEQFTTITLEVREHNSAAIGLYTKLGFTPIAMRKKYYADTGENALIMIKYLD